MRVTFFCFAKRKSPKKRRPPVCDPCAALRGDLRRVGCGVRRGTRFAAAQRRSDNHGELDNKAWALGRPCSPRNRPDAGAASRGWQPNSRIAKQPDIHSGHRVARPRLRSAKRLRPQNGAERSAAKQWPAWMSAPRVPFRMRRGAQGPADQGSRLSERSEFERDPAGREHRRFPLAPARACGDAACRVAFSLVTFFWRSKRKPLRRRAHTPASALNPSTPLQPARKASTSSARTGVVAHTLRQAQPHR